jgi:hypothetical protein
MRYEQVAPFIGLLLNVASLIGYACAGDWHKAAYWFGAAIISSSLIF